MVHEDWDHADESCDSYFNDGEMVHISVSSLLPVTGTDEHLLESSCISRVLQLTLIHFMWKLC